MKDASYFALYNFLVSILFPKKSAALEGAGGFLEIGGQVHVRKAHSSAGTSQRSTPECVPAAV
jgi:hypothetical protein